MRTNRPLSRRKSSIAVTAAATLSMLVLAACGSTGGGSASSADTLKAVEAVPVGKTGTEQPDGDLMKKLCTGDKKIKVGFTWGFEGNSWRKQVLGELKDEASKCPNITSVTSAASNFDLQKSIADINGMVAKGVDVLIVMPDAGPGLIPALRKASKSGVWVVPFATGESFPGKPGTDYYDTTTEILSTWGEAWGDWMAKQLDGKGNIVFLGGSAGSPTSDGELVGLKKSLKKNPGIKLLTGSYTVTDFDPAKAQQAMAGLLTKYPDIDGVVTDYGTLAVAAIRAYKAANRPLVPIASLSENDLACAYEDNKASNPKLELMTLSSRPWLIRSALRRGTALALGTENDEPSRIEMEIIEDTTNNMPPKCNKDLPADADLTGHLSDEQLVELFGKG